MQFEAYTKYSRGTVNVEVIHEVVETYQADHMHMLVPDQYG